MAPRILRFKKTIVIASIAALSVAGAGAAFAFWSSTGTGDGTATTGQAVQFVITEGAKAGTLAPGNLAGQTVAFTVSNPGPGQLYLGTVTVTLADAAGVAWAPVTTQPTPGTMRCQRLCPAGHSHAGRPDPGGSTAFAGASIGFNDKSTNQDACKGATIPLLYTANPDQRPALLVFGGSAVLVGQDGREALGLFCGFDQHRCQ